jgi:putative transposase
MPRLARNVFPGIPHHITQRGNRREDVFFTNDDRHAYLNWFKEYSQEHQVDVLAYCLMTNHIHLVVVPNTAEGLNRMLKPLHMRYAQRINREKGWKGHLWQGRYFSSPLDDAYLWAAIRYVECNPVRAKMVRIAERYPWSSAAAHCGLRDDGVLTQKLEWKKLFDQIPDWSAWLAEGEDANQLSVLRRNIDKGLPCGTERFIKRLERLTGRVLQYRPQGRPRQLDIEE